MLSLDLVYSDKGLPFINSEIKFLVYSKCLKPKNVAGKVLIFKLGLYKFI